MEPLFAKWRNIFLSEECGKHKSFYVLFVALLLLQLCPIWFAAYPAMHDYPNHLARAHILHEYNDTASYQATYNRDGRLIPNLSMDLIVTALMNHASVETSSKIFLSLVVLVFNFGLYYLGITVNGRPHWNVLPGTFFMYNFAFSYGFVNYMFGIGMFFLTLALWLKFRERWTMSRILFVSSFTILSYVSHLSSFIFFTLSITCLTVVQLIKTKSLRTRQAVGMLPAVIPTLAYLSYSLEIEQKAPLLWWHPLLLKKFTGLVYPFLSYNLFVDLLLGTVFVSLMLFLWREKQCHILSKELVLLSGVFVILYAFAPMSGAQSSYVDRRFLLPVPLFALLGVRINILRPLGRTVMAGLIVLSLVRIGEVWHYWNRIGQGVQEQVHMLDRLPDGARLYPMVVHDQSSPQDWLWDMHFFFSAHYATIYRHAFVPTIYAWKEAHPLNLRVTESDYTQVEKNTPFDRINWNQIFTHYDYLWGYKLSPEFREFLSAKAELIAQSGDSALFRIAGRSSSL